jgi:hypothetical protein
LTAISLDYGRQNATRAAIRLCNNCAEFIILGRVRVVPSNTGSFRVRADFTPSAKDAANVGTDGGWLYYEVTK